MATIAPRPRGVLVAAILLIASGIFNIISSVIAITATMGEATPDQESAAGLATMYLGATIVIGILNIILAIGILRGSRISRTLVTILQALTVAIGLIGLSSSEAAQDFTRYALTAIVTPLAIISMLWIGAQTKEFFARRK